MQFFNHYSYVIIMAIFGLGVMVTLWRWKGGAAWLRAAMAVSFVAIVVVLGLTFRPPSSDVKTLEDVDAVLSNGQPTFLMLYSNY